MPSGTTPSVSSCSRSPTTWPTSCAPWPCHGRSPRWLYEEVYCARGQADNLIKAHKLHLASDRTSCSKATANQFRLLIHTAAYWLLHSMRGLAPKTSFWRAAQFEPSVRADQAGRPRHRNDDPDQGRTAVGLSLSRNRARCPPAPPSCRPDRRGCVPPPEPVPRNRKSSLQRANGATNELAGTDPKPPATRRGEYPG